jgi:hypothetical protein
VGPKSEPRKDDYRERAYRGLVAGKGLVSFQVQVKETDLFIQAQRELQEKARHSVLRYRYQIETYLQQHPEFFHSLAPLNGDEFAPPLVKEMLRAAKTAGVGPMAAVAGAMAEFVGRDLLSESPEVIVENGGDIFIRAAREVKIAIFAGSSPLSLRVGLIISEAAEGMGVCTSSGTVGPSLSFGKADAACILAPSAALADAAATAVGNVVQSPGDLEAGLKKAREIEGVTGAVLVLGDKLGAWGAVELFEMRSGER